MHPQLLKIGSITLHTYGFMIVVGFLIGLYLVYRQAKVEGLDQERMVDLSFWGLAMGLVGGRTFYILTRFEYFLDHPLEIFAFWEGGLVFYGGFLGGVAGFYFFSKRYKLPTLKAMDLAVPSLAIAHFFGRLGCFFAGCCFGKPCTPELPWSIVFKDPNSLAPPGIPLHPAQLYDAANALIIFAVTFFLRNRKKFTGQLLVVYMFMYSIGRSIVEIYRGDTIRGFVIDPWLSTSQFLSIITFGVGIYLWKYWSKKYPIVRK
ncbi:MAG: prolipoprotein diacylglyceryl transferase [Oligoflexia bacterium]|nr:prolipoprotein diacylglyceryl transferase [Oligoflexia bacterium]